VRLYLLKRFGSANASGTSHPATFEAAFVDNIGEDAPAVSPNCACLELAYDARRTIYVLGEDRCCESIDSAREQDVPGLFTLGAPRCKFAQLALTIDGAGCSEGVFQELHVGDLAAAEFGEQREG
jgi:hypothetical protein